MGVCISGLLPAVYMYRRRMSDTCCAGWGLSLMTKPLKSMQISSGFGNRLHNSINFKRKF